MFGLNNIIQVRGHSILGSVIPKAGVVVDLGANTAEFSKQMISTFGVTAFAVEASPYLAAQIDNLIGLHVSNYAVSDVNGSTILHISSNPEGSSILSLRADKTAGEVVVPSITLDSFLEIHGISKVNVLKVDIEGAEKALFRTTPDSTLRMIDQITIEFHDFCGHITDDEISLIIARLERNGFTFLRIPSKKHGYNRKSNMDCLFVNKKAIEISEAQLLLLAVLHCSILPFLGLLRSKPLKIFTKSAWKLLLGR